MVAYVKRKRVDFLVCFVLLLLALAARCAHGAEWWEPWRGPVATLMAEAQMAQTEPPSILELPAIMERPKPAVQRAPGPSWQWPGYPDVAKLRTWSAQEYGWKPSTIAPLSDETLRIYHDNVQNTTRDPKAMKRYPGPRHPWPHAGCYMCLGIHLVSVHGLDRNLVYREVPVRSWGMLHDNVHNQPELSQVTENIYAPTPEDLIEHLLKLAGAGPGQTVYDLGSGDGRILVTAAGLGCRAIGYEIDPELVAAAKARAAKARVDIEVRQTDLFTADLSDADVIYVYLFPSPRLQAKLAEAPRDARIVSYLHPMGLPGEQEQQVWHLGHQLSVWIR